MPWQTLQAPQSSFSSQIQRVELLVWMPHLQWGTFCQISGFSVAPLSIKVGCVYSHVGFCFVVKRKWIVSRKETFSETLHKNGPQIERCKDCLGKCSLGIK